MPPAPFLKIIFNYFIFLLAILFVLLYYTFSTTGQQQTKWQPCHLKEVLK